MTFISDEYEMAKKWKTNNSSLIPLSPSPVIPTEMKCFHLRITLHTAGVILWQIKNKETLDTHANYCKFLAKIERAISKKKK
jgi:hypothetical protein